MAELGTRYHTVRVEDDAPVDDGFVLRVRKDPVGWLAAWYYASLTYNAELGTALRQWLLQNTPQEESLGSEGQVNRQALDNVKAILASPGV
ncbi:MAG: hypothetical protein ACE5IG_07560 [Dehalococcoidia bacterium]